MDDVIVVEQGEEERRRLCNLLIAYQIAENVEFEIESFDYAGIHEAWSGTKLFFLDGTDASALTKTAAAIRRDGWAHRIALVLPTLATLADCLTPDVLPVGLLIKPVALDKLTALLNALSFRERNEQGSRVFLCPQKGRNCRISYDEILFFESRNKKTVLVTDTQEYELYTPLEELENTLGVLFVRSHRSFLVNTSRIREIDREQMVVVMEDGSRALLSRMGKMKLRQVMDE